eukprot:767130-Rhodomonas_salina.2
MLELPTRYLVLRSVWGYQLATSLQRRAPAGLAPYRQGIALRPRYAVPDTRQAYAATPCDRLATCTKDVKTQTIPVQKQCTKRLCAFHEPRRIIL